MVGVAGRARNGPSVPVIITSVHAGIVRPNDSAMNLRHLRYSVRSGHLGAPSFNVNSVQRLASSHEQPVSLGAAETEIRARFRKVDFSDQRAIRREHMHPVVS